MNYPTTGGEYLCDEEGGLGHLNPPDPHTVAIKALASLASVASVEKTIPALPSYEKTRRDPTTLFSALGEESKIIEATTTAPSNTRPNFPIPYPLSREACSDLHKAIWENASSLSIADFAVLADGKPRLPKSMADYRLVPVIHPDPRFLEHNLSSVSSNLITADGVAFEYGKVSDRRIFADGRIILGIAYRGRLVAVCAGGLSKDGPIITQLQDVSSKTPPSTDDPKILRSFKYSNGLNSGMDWKLTLVHAWCEMVNQTVPQIVPGLSGTPIRIQSARNNNWVNRQQYSSSGAITGYKIDQERLVRLERTYDGTAAKLRAIPDPTTGNYILPAGFNIIGCTT